MNFLNSKKGFFMSGRDWISFFIGIVLFLIGIVPLLKQFKVLGFGLPSFLNGLMAQIFFWIIAIAGVYIIVDGLIEPAGHALHIFLMVLGLIFVIVGLVPILNKFGVIHLNLSFLANLVVYNSIITIEGLMLMTAGFTMR
ncbi:MAG: hypothetical protein V1866_04295 [archaeon]